MNVKTKQIHDILPRKTEDLTRFARDRARGGLALLQGLSDPLLDLASVGAADDEVCLGTRAKCGCSCKGRSSLVVCRRYFPLVLGCPDPSPSNTIPRNNHSIQARSENPLHSLRDAFPCKP